MAIKSVNLSKRNEQVIKAHFKTKGRNGGFSSWVNKMMDKEFTLSPEEALRDQIRKNAKQIETIQNDNEKLIKKLRVEIDKVGLK